MSGPKTLAAHLRNLSQGRKWSADYRARKRGDCVAAGPVNVPVELVRAMKELGYIEGAESREAMSEAMAHLLERLAGRAGDLPEFMSDDEEYQISSPLFCQKIGLPSAPRLPYGTVERAVDGKGFKLVVKKK